MEKGLSAKGTKAELQQRLFEALSETPVDPSPAETDSLQDFKTKAAMQSSQPIRKQQEI